MYPHSGRFNGKSVIDESHTKIRELLEKLLENLT